MRSRLSLAPPVRGGRVVVVDDDRAARRALTRHLEDAGFEVAAYESAPEALAAIADDEARGVPVDVVLSDRQMPGMDGNEMLGEVRQRWPDLPFILLTGIASTASALEAMEKGAYDYLSKSPDRPGEIAHVVGRAVERSRLLQRNHGLELALGLSARFADLIGESPAMQAVFQQIETVAPSDATVLLLGESGTGKEMAARAIAERSQRRDRPFVAVNCAALPDTLLESELFGHVKGAYTGATQSRAGMFDEANRGTIFLDEIGDVSLAMQVRLLRVLQEGEIRSLGATAARKVDVRVLAATNRDLPAAIAAGSFRQDLFYRLDVFTIRMPALRDRAADLPLLVRHLARKHAARCGRATIEVDPVAALLLLEHEWPGNVRELENVIQRALLLARGDTITAAAIRDAMGGMPGAREVGLAEVPVAPVAAPAGWTPRRFSEARDEAMAAFARDYLESALRHCEGKVSEAARLAGVEVSNFRRLLKRYGVDSAGFR